MSKLLSVGEVANILGKSERTVYRYIKKGLLQARDVLIAGKKVTKVAEEDLEQFIDNFFQDLKWKGDGGNSKFTSGSYEDVADIKKIVEDSIRESVIQIMESTKTQLVKSVQDQATFIAGKLTKENEFLRERLEVVVEENRVLRESIKALPSPPEKVGNLLEEIRGKLDACTKELYQEKAISEHLKNELRDRQNEVKALTEKVALLQEEKNRLSLEKESMKDSFQSEKMALESTIDKLKKEKKNLEEEVSSLQRDLEEAKKCIEELKRELEKPWWRKIFQSKQ